MALETIVAGPYTGAYSGSDVGIVENGFNLRSTIAKQQILGGNGYGESVIDSVYLGANWFMQFVGMEYSSAVAAFWTYGALGVHGLVGRLDYGSSIAAAMVITAVAGTTAAAAPASLTSSQSIMDENINSELSFSPRARFVPITLRLYPYDNSGTVVWFTTT